MAQVLVTEQYLEDIADAIREKNSSENEYTPAQMAGAIEALPDAPVLVQKSITANGSYDPDDDSADGYSEVTVNVPNTYTASDEGKVVDSGALVAQGSDTVTENDTYDTTLISSLTVNVEGGGGGSVNILSGTDEPNSAIGSDGTIYLKHTNKGQQVTNLLASYQDIDDWTKNQAAFTEHTVVYENGESQLTHKGGNGYERIFVPIDVEQNTDYTFLIEFYAKTDVPSGYNGSLAISVAEDDQTTTGSSGSYNNFGKTNLNRSIATDYSTYYVNFNSGSHTRVYPVIDLNITDNSRNILMFKNIYLVEGTYTIIPIFGMITNSYLKVNGAWQNLIGSNIDDVDTGGGDSLNL